MARFIDADELFTAGVGAPRKPREEAETASPRLLSQFSETPIPGLCLATVAYKFVYAAFCGDVCCLNNPGTPIADVWIFIHIDTSKSWGDEKNVRFFADFQ